VALVARFPVHLGSRTSILTTAEHYLDGNFGNRLAQIRVEERRVDRDVWRLQSTLPDLRAGDVFGLDLPLTRADPTDAHHDHPAVHGEYLVVELRKHVDQRPHLESTAERREERDDVVAIRADVTYRPPRTTPKPRIDGLLYAWIDGVELGTPAPLDEHGSYKVVLPFDSVPKEAGRASRWIRMAQPLAGQGTGIHFPLHEGTEVVLAHVQGDPDRPLIVGAVPNARTPSPVTSANPTQSVIRTYSGITMEFEDDA
jgi:type VI secretion system secreted protein VgrG